MKKQFIIAVIIVTAISFYLGRISKGDPDMTIPNPEEHIRTAFHFLQENDQKSYEALLMTNDERRFLEKSRFEDEFPEDSSNMNKKLVWEVFIEEDYTETSLDAFADAYNDDNIEWKNAEIEKVKYKIKGDSKRTFYITCNAKIYFKAGERHFRIKYRQCIYYKGKWFGGVFSSIRELFDDEQEDIDNELDYPEEEGEFAEEEVPVED